MIAKLKNFLKCEGDSLEERIAWSFAVAAGILANAAFLQMLIDTWRKG